MAEDDIWESWEDLADSKDLNEHVDQHLCLTNGNHHEDDDAFEEDVIVKQRNITNSVGNGQNVGGQFQILPRPVVHEDDINRTAYIPQVKILKRPGKDSRANLDEDKGKQKSQPARTLAEREAAYAEARKRIMGPVQAQTNTGTTSTSKARSDTRKAKDTKSRNSQTIAVERLPKGPDKKGRGFTVPR